MRKKVGVVLFQLGGPDSPDAVEPFLYNLFCDPDIIPLGALGAILRKPLARYISRKRSKVAAAHYAEIGGQSPIRQLTERQARKLEATLGHAVDARVFIAMRYWHPLTQKAIDEVRDFEPDALVLLPMYPQYSYATTRSSLKEWRRLYQSSNPTVEDHLVERFYDHPLYIEAVVDRIELALSHFHEPHQTHIVFSAHGLPLSLIEKGDPYQEQIEETVRLVLEDGRWPNAHTLCFQSRVGRQKWLEPSLDTTIENLARAGEKNLLVVPISFVTEHIETLHEINIEAREHAMKLGVEQFEMMPAVGDSPRFIGALADLVLRAVGVETAQPARVG
ncbi:MAG TPA: ferrochelatase [Candidatus Acidoferrum sp.]|nr:ferrochelatase [Candidatus Acidoferrum sp.]